MHGGTGGRPPIHGRFTNAALAERKRWLTVERELRELIEAME
jgi:hypothetical protein